MLKTAIFDLDGLLVYSEPLWEEAELNVIDKLNLKIDKSKSAQTTGLRVDEVVEYWNRAFNLGFNEAKIHDIANDIMDEVIQLIKEKGYLMPGVEKVLELTKNKFGKIALASSSYERVIHAEIQHFNIQDYFDVIHSAQNETYGKPHPAVYINTAKQLNVAPTKCLAFEDSINGTLAAKAAKMTCVSVPAKEDYNKKQFGITNYKLNSLEDFSFEILKDTH